MINKLNKTNIKYYLENEPKQFRIFDIPYPEKTKKCLDNFKIESEIVYNNYGDNNLDDLKEYLKKIGSNSDEDINLMDKTIKDLTEIVMSSVDKKYTNYWLTVRATLPTDKFDIKRWHCDGNYFGLLGRDVKVRPDLNKFVTILQGPGTFFIKTTPKERELFNSIEKEELEKSKLREPDNKSRALTDMEYRKGIDSRVEGIRVQAEKYQAAIFISAIDERNICGIHSEPPKNVNRMFLSIVPCSKEESEVRKIRNASKFTKICSNLKNVMGGDIPSLPFNQWNLYEINSNCGKVVDKYGLFNIIERKFDDIPSSNPNLVVMAGFSTNSFCGTSEIIMMPSSIAELRKKYRAIYIINYDEDVFKGALNKSFDNDKKANKDFHPECPHSLESRLKLKINELTMLDEFGTVIDKILRCPDLNLKNVHILGKSIGSGLALHTIIKSDIYTALFLAVPASPTYMWPLERLSDDRLRSITIKCGWNKNDDRDLYGIPSFGNPPYFLKSIRELSAKRKMPELLENYKQYEFDDGNKHEVYPGFINKIVNE